MTEAELQAIEARINPGPATEWDAFCVQCGPRADTDEDGCCQGCGCDAIGMWSTMAANAPTDIAALLAEVRRLRRAFDGQELLVLDCIECGHTWTETFSMEAP